MRRYDSTLNHKRDEFRPYNSDDDANGFTPRIAVLQPGVVARAVDVIGGIDVISLFGKRSMLRFKTFGMKGQSLGDNPSDRYFDCNDCTGTKSKHINAEVIAAVSDGELIATDEAGNHDLIRFSRRGVFEMLRQTHVSRGSTAHDVSDGSGFVATRNFGYWLDVDPHGRSQIVVYNYARGVLSLITGARAALPRRDHIGSLALDPDGNICVLEGESKKRLAIYRKGQSGDFAPVRTINLPGLEGRKLGWFIFSRKGSEAYIVTYDPFEPKTGHGNSARVDLLKLNGNVGTVARSVEVPLYCNESRPFF